MVTVYLFTIIFLIFLIFLNFLLPRLLPRNVILAMYSGQETLITEEMYNELVTLHGFDKTLYEQLSIYLTQPAHGDLGYSYVFHAATADLILAVLPWTLLLVVTSFKEEIIMQFPDGLRLLVQGGALIRMAVVTEG